MNEIIEVENYIDAEWMRHLHLMSKEEFKASDMQGEWFVPEFANVVATFESGMHHLRASWKARGAFAGTLRDKDRREKQIVVWAFEKGKPVSDSIREAADVFRKVFFRNPDFAAVKLVPEAKGAFVDVEIGGWCVGVVECADVLPGFVMLF